MVLPVLAALFGLIGALSANSVSFAASDCSQYTGGIIGPSSYHRQICDAAYNNKTLTGEDLTTCDASYSKDFAGACEFGLASRARDDAMKATDTKLGNDGTKQGVVGLKECPSNLDPPGADGEIVELTGLQSWFDGARGPSYYDQIEASTGHLLGNPGDGPCFSRTKFEPMKPIDYEAVKKEGPLDPPSTILSTVEGEYTYQRKYDAFGYFKNIDFCIRSGFIGPLIPLSPLASSVYPPYNAGRAVEYWQEQVKDKTKFGCMYGQTFDLLYRSGAGDLYGFEQEYQPLIDVVKQTATDNVYDDGKSIWCSMLHITPPLKLLTLEDLDLTDLESKSAYNDGCLDGINNPISLEVVFLGGAKETDGKADPTLGLKCDVSGKEGLAKDDPGCVKDEEPSNGDAGGTSSGDSSGSGGGGAVSGADPVPLPPPADPCESPDGCYVIEPCDAAALAVSDYYKVDADNHNLGDGEEDTYSIKRTVWDSFIASGLTPEQTAAIMGNIQGVSKFNPASITATTVMAGAVGTGLELEAENEIEILDGDEINVNDETEIDNEDEDIDDQAVTEEEAETTSESVIEAEKPAQLETISGLGLAHWNDPNVIEAMLVDFARHEVLKPFFEEVNWGLYGSGAIDGDRFMEIAIENNVADKAKTLVDLQIAQIQSDLEGTNFTSYYTVETAAEYFYSHLIKTTGSMGTTVPASFVDNARAILDEFYISNEGGDNESTTNTDNLCADGIQQALVVSSSKKLLETIEASVAGYNLKNEAYSQALAAANVNAQFDGKDSFAFVAAMMRASGFHKNYPVTSAASIELLDDSSSWEKTISNKKLKNINNNELRVGDVLVSISGGNTMIFIGEQTFSDKKPFALAKTSGKYPYYTNASVDTLSAYNVYRRKAYSTAIASDGSEATLAIATYNIRTSAADKNNSHKWANRREAVVSYIRQFDIVGVQEGTKESIAYIRQQLGSEYGSCMRKGATNERVIFYKTSVIESAQCQGQVIIQKDKNGSKRDIVWMVARVRQTNLEFVIVDTHLTYNSAANQLAEVKAITNIIKKWDITRPMLLVGDMNSPEGGEVDKLIRKAGLSNVYGLKGLVENYKYNSFGGYKSPQNSRHIDHIYYMNPSGKDSLRTTVNSAKIWKEAKSASDHLPVSVNMTIRYNSYDNGLQTGNGGQ
jgi:endonuclease/exonuclease/phosphatase family metal-dependent hydrolase